MATNRANARTLLLFCFFFLVIMAFWCLKPLRTAGVVKALGPDIYPLIKQGSLLIVPLVMLFYDACVARFSRSGFVRLFTTLFMVGCVAFWAGFTFLSSAPVKLAFFYFVDIYSTVMVTLFWTYLNSTFTPEEAKGAYGTIGSGGLLGGIFGSSVSGWANELLGAHIILVAGVLLGGVLWVVRRLEGANPSHQPIAPARTEKVSAWSSSTEGARMVLGSPYLVAMVAVVGLYEVVSSLIDYQFNASCAAHFANELAMAGYQGRVFFVGQVLSLGVMLTITPVVFKRFGVMVGLMLLPLALGFGSLAFALIPALWVITGTTGAEMAFAYSINQAAKEILYLPLTTIEKFKAKAVIDMFVNRLAKAMGAAAVLGYVYLARPRGIPSTVLMGLAVVLIGVWVLAVRRVAKRFEETSERPAPTKLAA